MLVLSWFSDVTVLVFCCYHVSIWVWWVVEGGGWGVVVLWGREWWSWSGVVSGGLGVWCFVGDGGWVVVGGCGWYHLFMSRSEM